MARLNRGESPQQTRARLMAAAQEVFARHGYMGASIDRIADHAGHSKGAVYSNFSNKETLFLELLRSRMAEELEIARQIRNLYTIAYAPLNQALDGTYRTIRVAVSVPEHLSVRTRAGYRATRLPEPNPNAPAMARPPKGSGEDGKSMPGSSWRQ